MLKKKEIQENDILVFQNKFGSIEVNTKYKIFFPKGLIGLADSKMFCLADANNDKYKSFKLLQSIESGQLCFLTLPISFSNSIIKERDLLGAIDTLELIRDEVAVILLCSTKNIDNKLKLAVNARAPIFLNLSEQTAFQYVLHNSNYSLAHPL
ncbi:flagellar assembly protein FliW [Candidatus Bandiella numerosa]|jgi:flagellar assembly factor FliW|uniref:flagellar assembly protein FliW n=1 Tax=Candidatus Bandiella numerosa TaxID=2570586 RepID=UPI00249F3BD6|nr:flagellar assembly protein FliW [Candidatus Bandiella numerosa]WHA04738.1 flagellar assembly protein FliW [Candidatus Bandiella numerosa]